MSAAPKLRLFDRPSPRKKDRTVLKPHHLEHLQTWASYDGLTDAEFSHILDCSPSNARGRRTELVGMGLVEDSGATRKTPAGVAATVWCATAAGKALLRKVNR